jgi:hypothetical protein
MSALREKPRKFGEILRNALKRWRNVPEEPRLHRVQTKFRKRYPDYRIGTGSYDPGCDGSPLLCSDDLRKFLAYADARKNHDVLGANG